MKFILTVISQFLLNKHVSTFCTQITLLNLATDVLAAEHGNPRYSELACGCRKTYLHFKRRMKNLLRTSDIHSAVKPLYYVSKAFGLAPFSYKKNQHNGREDFDFRCVDVILTVMWLIGLVVGFALHMSHDILYKQQGMPTKICIALDIYLTSLYLTSITSLILGATVNRKKVPQLIAKVSEADQTLFQNLEDNSVFKKTRLYLLLQLVALTAVLGFLHCYNVYSFYDGTLWGCAVMISENFSFLLNTLVTIQFVDAVVMLKERYASINRLLIDPKRMDMWSGVEVNEVVTAGNNIDAKLPENHKKEGIHALRVIHCQLHDTVMLIISNYGIPIFMITFWIFMTIVFVLYYGLFSLQEVISSPTAAEQHEVILSLCWCMFCITLLVAMTLSCHMTTQEANLTVILVEKLLLCRGLGDDTVNELKDFSTQLSNMRTEFSAGGFFTLNLSFLYAMTGVICSHIIILASLN